MKYLFNYIFAASVFTSGISPQAIKNQFVLDGTIKGQEQEWIYLGYQDAGGKYVRDSAIITNYRFSFKGAISEPTRAFLGLKQKKGSSGNDVKIFLEPGTMTVVLETGHFRNALVTGSATQVENALLQARLSRFYERWKPVTDSLTTIGRRDNFKFQELKGWILPVYTEEIQEINIWFLTAYPRSYVSADVILNCIHELTTDSIKLFYGRLDEKVRNSSLGKNVAAVLEERKTGMPGTTAAAFSASDINGVELRLGDLKGKYVLLDFWASWCLPCRKLNPHLKELYTQYGPKGFEVIGVASDDRTPDDWKKAVAQDGLPWRHVLAGSIGRQYNIQELPTQILVDPAGKIIARYGGGQGGEEHAALDKKLETIFK